MSSWRESDDPRCPVCDEKITSTASYCMHCEADFAPDGSVVSGSGDETPDDFSYAGGTAGPGSTDSGGGDAATAADEWTGPDDSADVDDSDDFTGGESGGPDVGQSSTPEVGQSSAPEVGQSSTPEVGQYTGDGANSGSVEKTTLLLRVPVSVMMGLPAGIMTFIAMLMAFGSLSATWAGTAFLAGWLGVTGYLLTKPLASDAIGDAFYVYAVLLLGLPVALSGGMVVRSLLGISEESIGDAVGVGIVMELFFAFPAAFFLLVGYAANYYAKQKMEEMLDQRDRAA